MFKKILAIPHFHFDVEWWKDDVGHAEDAVIIIKKALELLDKYPEFTYVLDQGFAISPYLEKYPEEKQKIINLIKEDRIEIVGGTLAAPDENIPYGEALIRQFYYGKKFAKDLRQEVKVAWEIDEFGHPHQMPQILKKCGFEYFVFSRGVIPWNKIMPLDFFWEGPDGSKILTHWLAAHYCGMMVFYKDKDKNIKRFYKELKARLDYEGKRAVVDILLAPFGTDFTIPYEGWVDFLEIWNKKETPRIEFSLPLNYFEKIKKEKFKTILGEFNPLFTGCYSSREKVKKYCRETQNKILTAEKLTTISSFFDLPYPQDDFDVCWENILKNDFHDTICGTGTDKVYQKTIKRYKTALKIIDKNISASLDKICERIDFAPDKNLKPMVIFNPLPWERIDVVEIEGVGYKVNTPSLGYRIIHPDKKQDKASDIKVNTKYLENEYFTIELDKWGNIISLFDKELKCEHLKTNNFSAGKIIIEGDVGNLWTIHKTGKIYREDEAEVKVVEKGPARGILEIKTKQHKSEIVKRVIIYSGKRRIDFEVDINFSGKDKIIKVVFPTNISGKCYFETPFYVAERGDGIWCAQNFADISDGKQGLAVINSGNPGYEINKGEIGLILFRSVSLFSLDLIKFILKKFPDIVKTFREGISLHQRGLNIMEMPLYKYHGLMLREWATEGGPDCFGSGELRSHLIASLKFLKKADAWEQGSHKFKYAIYPHSGDFRSANLPRVGYEFNNPLITFIPKDDENNPPSPQPSPRPKPFGFVCPGEGALPLTSPPSTGGDEGEGEKLKDVFSFLKIDKENLILNVLKKSGDNVVVRIYETQGKDVDFNLTFFKEIKSVQKISAIEDEIYEEVKCKNNTFSSSIKKWEIATYKIIVI